VKHAVVVSRLFAPEPAAAAFRLEALVRALAGTGCDVTVLTSRARPGSPPPDDAALSRPPAPRADDGDAAAPGQLDPTPRLADAPEPGHVRPPRLATRTGRVRVRRARVLRDASGYVRGYLPYLSFDAPVALRLLTVRRPDVVVVEPPPTTGVVVRIVCALRRVPYVYYAADIWSDAARSTGSPGLVSGLLSRLEGWAMRGARGVVAVSEGVADRVQELAGRGGVRRGAGLEAVEVVRNGVDTTVFRPDDGGATGCFDTADGGTGGRSDAADGERPGTQTPDGAHPAIRPPVGAPAQYFLYAGTASEWQGAEVFVLALATLRETHPDVELVFLGSGSAWAGLRDLADRAAPGAVHLRAPVSPAEAARWHRHAAGALVSIVPGLGYDFALPTKLFAASASGVPVVFAGPPGTARDVVVEGALGIAVGHDPEAVAIAMASLLDAPETTDPALRAARAARLAAWTAEHASIDRVGQTVASLVARWAEAEEGKP